MADRQWTGSVDVLPDSLRELAMKFASTAMTASEALRTAEDRSDVDRTLAELINLLRDEAYTLNEWGDAVEQLYVKADEPAAPGVLTNVQGVEIAKRFNERTLSINVTRGSLGLPDDYVYLVIRSREGADFHCGIDPKGRVSS